MKKIDIHCHILPDVDDGAENVEESRQMLRIAYEQGFEAVIATSHHSKRYQKATPQRILQTCSELEQWAREELTPEFRIYPGQEIFFVHGMVEEVADGRALSLAGSPYILVEFLPTTPYSTIYQMVREMAVSPYRPVLAHIERYRELRKEDRVEELIYAGALMQMNYGPISGKWYDETTRWCRRTLLEGNIHFLATDMHNTRTRAPRTEKAVQWMQKNLDEEYMDDICWRNAKRYILDAGHK